MAVVTSVSRGNMRLRLSYREFSVMAFGTASGQLAENPANMTGGALQLTVFTIKGKTGAGVVKRAGWCAIIAVCRCRHYRGGQQQRSKKSYKWKAFVNVALRSNCEFPP